MAAAVDSMVQRSVQLSIQPSVQLSIQPSVQPNIQLNVQPNVVPPSHTPLSTIQQLHPDSVQLLVSTVAAEVTRQLAATQPALTLPEQPNTASAIRCVAEPTEERCQSAAQLPAGSASTLVEGAIVAAHSRIATDPNVVFQ